MDFWRFPEKIDLLASSFAGGASGYPLCFETVEPERKHQVIARNRRSSYTTNKMVLQKIKPKAFLPYAGFFKEKAKRDCYIRENNKKNTIDVYADLCQNLDIRLIDVTKTPLISITKSEILDHQRMNRPGQKFYKVLAESALRAVRLCQPLKVPPTGYDKWKEIQLNFNPTEMLRG